MMSGVEYAKYLDFTCPRCSITTRSSEKYYPAISLRDAGKRICHDCNQEEIEIDNGMDPTANEIQFLKIINKE